MSELGVYASSMGSLLAALVARTPGAAHAALASIDGVALATSTGLPTERATQLASIGAGLLSIANGAGVVMSTGVPIQVVVDMVAGVLLATPVRERVCLTALAAADCDRERLGYEISQFTEQVAPLLDAV